MEYKTEFSALFIETINDLGISRAEVSRAVGINRGNLTHQLLGKKKIGASKILEIVEFLNSRIPNKEAKLDIDEWLSSCGFIREEVKEVYHKQPKKAAKVVLNLR